MNAYDVCILGGLGHVGLPLGISLAHAGKRVVLYDINEAAARKVEQGQMPFLENGAEEILKTVIGKTLFVSKEKGAIAQSRYIVIVIGTPVDEHLNPNFTIFKRLFDDIVDSIRDGHHIILRSTVYPGSTEKIKAYLESKGKKTRVSFCPERISQGNAMEELKSLPQIVSSFDEKGVEEAGTLFSLLTPEILVLTPVEAEFAKLFTNVWRYIQFAISNQFYQIATHYGIDFYRIYEAVTHNYPRAENFPRAGFAAGPCLFKDTMQIAAFTNNNFFLGHAAMLINEGLPNFIVQKLKEKYDLKKKTVGILGMAFKADNDDKRESLSYKLKKILEIEAKNVLCSDVYIREEGFVSDRELLLQSDIVVLGAPHKEYAELQFKTDQTVVDIWNYFGKGGLF
ncbi:MAG: nucleotide sugar dehydrogenase [Deltaproteobacteria bacterium]|nr:nucleotide sugar dehydrogenase [Deltaproteobacteria bacterium]